MEYNKIKKAATADPTAEFVMASYSGDPNPRWAKKAVLVDTNRYQPIRWFGNALDPVSLAKQQTNLGAGSGSGLLAKITDLDGSNEHYAIVPTRWIKGLYSDYQKVWGKQALIEKEIHLLQSKIDKIRRTQETTHQLNLKTKEKAIQDFMAKFAEWKGNDSRPNWYGGGEPDALTISTNIRVEFGKIDYPDFVASGFSFNDDPNVYEVKVSGSAQVGIDLLETLMESMFALQAENKALAVELDREKRNNGN
jgi:hypothetical protein